MMTPNETVLVMTNLTDPLDQLSPALIVLRTAYIALVSFAIISGNALTLAVMWRVRGEFPSGSTKLVMSSLALSDLGVGVLSTLYIPLSAMDRWPLGEWPCTAMCSALALMGGISVLNLMSLTLDRLVAITRPFSYATLLSRNRVLCMTLFQWIGSTIFVAVIMATVRPVVRYNRAAAMCLIENSDDALPLDLNFLCLMFILPMSIILGIYFKLIHTSHQQAKKINTENTLSQGGNAKKTSSGKAVRLFCMITVVYTVSWLPFLSLRLYADLNVDKSPPWLQFICVWLAVNNSWWNCIIYIVMNKTFRSLSREILKELFKR